LKFNGLRSRTLFGHMIDPKNWLSPNNTLSMAIARIPSKILLRIDFEAEQTFSTRSASQVVGSSKDPSEGARYRNSRF
jgi:hypothetical protein